MKKVYALHGADNKAGVTMLSLSIAQIIAKEFCDKDILLMSLSLGQSDHYLREDVSNIDYYKNRIDSGLKIEKSAILQGRLTENLYMIDGLKEELQQRLYFPNNIKLFVNNLRDEFDLVILDTGSHIDSGLAIGGLIASDVKYLVLPQSEIGLERYIKRKEIYQKSGIDFDYYIVNRFDDNDVVTLDYIRKKTRIKGMKPYIVREVKESRRAEYEHKTFIELKDNLFCQDIDKITSGIKVELNWQNIEQKKRKKWISFI